MILRSSVVLVRNDISIWGYREDPSRDFQTLIHISSWVRHDKWVVVLSPCSHRSSLILRRTTSRSVSLWTLSASSISEEDEYFSLVIIPALKSFRIMLLISKCFSLPKYFSIESSLGNTRPPCIEPGIRNNRAGPVTSCKLQQPRRKRGRAKGTMV